MQIERKHLSEIISHAREEAPREACGILAGRDGRVLRLYRARNADLSPTSYRLDPEQQYRILKDTEDRGLEVVAIYHSHPSSPPTPSEKDIKQAYDTEVSYLVISLTDSVEPQVRAFRFNEDGAVEEDMAVI